MATTTVSCPSCGSQVQVSDSPGRQVAKCPGCRKELEVDFGGTGVGAGVPSFQRAKPGEASAGSLSREEREKLETGGLGDLLFNPMEGLGRAFSGLGATASVGIAAAVFTCAIGSIWFLFFKGVAARYEATVAEVISPDLVSLSNHLSFAFLLLLVPLTLYLLLQLLGTLSQTSSPPWQILASTAVIFAPWAAILGLVSLVALVAPLRDAVAAPFADFLEFYQVGFASVPAGMNFVGWLMVVGIFTLAFILIAHPLLLTFSVLNHVVGMSPPSAFFITPFIPAMHFVLIVGVNALIGGLDFLQFDDIRALAS